MSVEEKKEQLASLIGQAIERTASARGVTLPEGFSVLLERPRREGQGDWATNAAMKLSKVFGMPPVDLAREIAGNFEGGNRISSVEVAPPGFMNFTLSDGWLAEVIEEVLRAGDDYGRNDHGGGKRVQIEFVSANPTGPIHLGHGRERLRSGRIDALNQGCAIEV